MGPPARELPKEIAEWLESLSPKLAQIRDLKCEVEEFFISDGTRQNSNRYFLSVKFPDKRMKMHIRDVDYNQIEIENGSESGRGD